jgi:hypothetical protein
MPESTMRLFSRCLFGKMREAVWYRQMRGNDRDRPITQIRCTFTCSGSSLHRKQPIGSGHLHPSGICAPALPFPRIAFAQALRRLRSSLLCSAFNAGFSNRSRQVMKQLISRTGTLLLFLHQYMGAFRPHFGGAAFAAVTGRALSHLLFHISTCAPNSMTRLRGSRK